jgi:hypothetical protein
MSVLFLGWSVSDKPGQASPEPAEKLPDVADEQARGLHGGKVAAAVELRPVRDLVLGVHHLPHEWLG